MLHAGRSMGRRAVGTTRLLDVLERKDTGDHGVGGFGLHAERCCAGRAAARDLITIVQSAGASAGCGERAEREGGGGDAA